MTTLEKNMIVFPTQSEGIWNEKASIFRKQQQSLHATQHSTQPKYAQDMINFDGKPPNMAELLYIKLILAGG